MKAYGQAEADAHAEFFICGAQRADPEADHNLRLILKIML
jgi:hypothetical protein